MHPRAPRVGSGTGMKMDTSEVFADIPCCPVCLEIIEDPVCLPCRHELCLTCYELNLSCANFTCPVCRRRISSWARKQAKQPVDMKRKQELEILYASYGSLDDLKLAVKLQTEENNRVVVSNNVGEINREFILAKEELEKEKLKQEELGEMEAVRLTEMEEKIQSDVQNQFETDEKLARELSTQCLSIDPPVNSSYEVKKYKNNQLKSSKQVTLNRWFSVIPK